MRIFILILPAIMLTSGCISTAAHLAALPVRATSKVVDWSTTSQEERDRNFGRAARRADEDERRWVRSVCRSYPDDCFEDAR